MKHAYLIIPNRPGKYRVEWYTVDSEGREYSVPCTGVGSVPDKYSATRERPRYRLGSNDDLDYDIKALTEETSGYDIVVMLDGHHPNYYVRKVDGLFGNLEPWAKDADAVMISNFWGNIIAGDGDHDLRLKVARKLDEFINSVGYSTKNRKVICVGDSGVTQSDFQHKLVGAAQLCHTTLNGNGCWSCGSMEGVWEIANNVMRFSNADNSALHSYSTAMLVEELHRRGFAVTSEENSTADNRQYNYLSALDIQDELDQNPDFKDWPELTKQQLAEIANNADAWFCAENSVCDAIHHCVDNAMLDFKADHPELFHAD